jgi:hypothetical protein
MPIWMLTYKKKDKTYVYAMNGVTGKLYGELPVSLWKILLVAAGVFSAALALFMWIAFMLFG